MLLSVPLKAPATPPAISTVAEVALSVVEAVESLIVIFSAARFSASPTRIPATLPNSLDTADELFIVMFLITVSLALPTITAA